MKESISRALFLVLALACLGGPAWAGGAIEGKVEYRSPRWVRDTVVYIEHVEGDFEPVDATVDQKGSTFIPKFTPVIAGATVTFTNSDPTDHNVYSPDGDYDLGTKPQGETLERKFEEPGVYTQLCKLHPTMIAYVIVTQNPYHAVSDADGNFKIEDVPPGEYRLLTWNERYKADPIEVKVTEGGTAAVTIELTR